jgi:hypothetical protein
MREIFDAAKDGAVGAGSALGVSLPEPAAQP